MTDAPAAMFSEPALAELQADPRFREAAEAMAGGGLAFYRGMDPVGRWMLHDLGRASLYLAALILDQTPDGLTAAGLVTAAASNKTCSPGRVHEFLKFAHDAGELQIPPGALPWTRRRLVLSPGFVARMRERMMIDIDAARRLDPAGPPSPDTEADFRRFLTWLGAFTVVQAHVVVGPWSPVDIFLARKSGMRILYDLMMRQPADRSRLLERASFSRSALARDYDVSRPHINRLLADAQAIGVLVLPAKDEVIFAPALSDNVSQTLAMVIQLVRASLAATAATAPQA